MGENSKIEWCDHTFNPWMGCTKVSDGCKHCYAETLMDKRWGKVQWGPQGERVRTSAGYWQQPLKWNRQAKADGVRRRVFCASLADVFEDRQELEPWRIDLMKLIEQTTWLDWLLLTKRPENVVRQIELAQDQAGAGIDAWGWLLRTGVWIGTSVEDQKTANERIPRLLAIPAAVRFLSVEPLLGSVDFMQVLTPASPDALRGIQWVIVGGESGQAARPMHPDWVRSIRDRCQAAGIPFFFKQWGEWWPHEQGQWIPSPLINHDVPDDEFYKVGKHAAGRLLDGRVWNQFPGDEG